MQTKADKGAGSENRYFPDVLYGDLLGSLHINYVMLESMKT